MCRSARVRCGRSLLLLGDGKSECQDGYRQNHEYGPERGSTVSHDTHHKLLRASLPIGRKYELSRAVANQGWDQSAGLAETFTPNRAREPKLRCGRPTVELVLGGKSSVAILIRTSKSSQVDFPDNCSQGAEHEN